MNNFHTSNHRTDVQLEALLHEAGHWVVNGRQGQALCSAASLRQAIEKARHYASSGAMVIALCRLPGDNIIIFSEQVERLRRIIAVREPVAPIAA